MLRSVFAVLLLALCSLTCTRHDKSFGGGTDKLETAREKFSYALGYDLGPSMTNIKSGIELRVFMRGLEDYFNGKPAQLDLRERQDIRSEEFTRLGEEYMQRLKELEQKTLAEGEAFLAANKSKPGVITTASGLQYEVLSEGNGLRPGPEDRIKVRHRGYFIDGKEFDDTDKLTRGFTIYLVKGVIPGWTEAFQLMRVGGKYRVAIPSNSAYGKIGREPDIPAYSVLIYEIELLEIISPNDEP